MKIAGLRRCRRVGPQVEIALALLLIFTLGTASAQNPSFGTREARPVPQWLNSSSIYELWLTAFSKEGNLRGAIPGLKRVADLGATIVYLGPIAKYSASPDASPYSVADYNAIDPAAGTAQDLHDFVAAAHKLHLKVMLDIVYYHTAPDNTMMKDDPSFFVKTQDGKIARGFWPQPLPDYKNPKVRKYLADSLVYWVRDFHVDGFRCDVGGGVPVSFWEEARKALDKVNPDVILLSESDRPDDQLQAFDINYNFQYYLTLVSVVRDGAPAIKVRENWEETNSTMPRGARELHYTDNHDWPRSLVQFGKKARWRPPFWTSRWMESRFCITDRRSLIPLQPRGESSRPFAGPILEARRKKRRLKQPWSNTRSYSRCVHQSRRSLREA